MTTNAIGTAAIGPTFGNELAAAGLAGVPMGWDAAGNFYYQPTMTPAQISAVQAVYAAHDPTKQLYGASSPQLAAAIPAGIQVTWSVSTALNGTYAIDEKAQALITHLYASIKGGDGLPLASATFTYHDISGAPHVFSAISFPLFAKAVRDFLYQLRMGQTPAQPVAITG